jgi:hypothetical protein
MAIACTVRSPAATSKLALADQELSSSIAAGWCSSPSRCSARHTVSIRLATDVSATIQVTVAAK